MAKKLILLLLFPLLLGPASGTLWGWHWFEPAARKNQKGIEAYRQGKFAEALEHFLSAKGLKTQAPQLKNNTAAALYELKKYQEALDEFSRIEPAKLGAAAAGLHYDLGNTYYRLGQFPKALENYKQSLRLAPNDLQAKKNFELTLKKIQEQQKQEQAQNPQQDPRADAEKQKQKYNAMMQFLNQNEKKQMEKKKRKVAPVKNEKDW